MRLLFVTSEIAPWVKTGGLGDVSAALPQALHKAGMDVRVLVPAYPDMKQAFPGARPVAGIIAPGGLMPSCRVLEAATASGLILWLLDAPELFIRSGGPYQTPEGSDWPDNPLRFALLARVGAILASDVTPLPWRPDIAHGNDWQSGLLPAYLKLLHGGGAKTVTTIHNLAFQGNFGKQWLEDVALPWDAWRPEGAEFHGFLSFLKAGLYYGDCITTVSPTYSNEIREEELGFGMAGLLKQRSAALYGILNGIDTDVWNPATDPGLPAHYHRDDLAGKAVCKAHLQGLMGLEVTSDRPLLGMVSRMTHQKGGDWVLEAAPEMIEAGLQLVVLGAGDRGIQAGFEELARLFPGSIGVRIGYDETLSHQIEAGSDIFLMPSRFEPCGLNQMYSLRYGTPPLVRPTGGLADTVTDWTEQSAADGSATGFVMQGADVASLLEAVTRAVAVWQDKDAWQTLQRAGMDKDFSWERAARDYLDLYGNLAARA